LFHSMRLPKPNCDSATASRRSCRGFGRFSSASCSFPMTFFH
jgi:hypothetical protein